MPRTGYGREIITVLCLKAAGLALLYMFFFTPSDRPAATDQAVARHLLLPAPSPESETKDDR